MEYKSDMDALYDMMATDLREIIANRVPGDLGWVAREAKRVAQEKYGVANLPYGLLDREPAQRYDA